MLQTRVALAALMTALATASTAAAADSVVAPDARAEQVTALDGTIVWVSAVGPEEQTPDHSETLWQRTPGGTVARVKGAPRMSAYGSVDLGRDSKNRLVLTYVRCNFKDVCRDVQDNLRGSRTGFKHLESRLCDVTQTPVRWRSKTAYGLSCIRPDGRRRTGLYVRTGSRAPRYLPVPAGAEKNFVENTWDVRDIDLRGTNVAAYSPGYQYAYARKTDGRRFRSISADITGYRYEWVVGMALGSGGTMYALINSWPERLGAPNRADLFRVGNTCYETEALVSPPGEAQSYLERFRAVDIAVDGSTVYLVVPGVGIVQHDFMPAGPCMPFGSG